MGWISDLLGNASVSIGGDNHGNIVNGRIVAGDLVGGSVHIGGGKESATLPVGALEESVRPVGDFDKIKAGLNFIVEWEQGPASAKVMASPNIQALIDVSVSGGTLCIDCAAGKSFGSPVVVKLSSPNLTHIEVYGACQMNVAQKQAGEPRDRLSALEVSARGASSAAVWAVVEKLVVTSEGASKVGASFDVSAKVAANGASSVCLYGFGRLDVKASGSAKVEQSQGLCAPTHVSASGASSIKACLEGVVGTCDASGAATVHCLLARDAAVETRHGGAASCKKTELDPSDEASLRYHMKSSAPVASSSPDQQTNASTVPPVAEQNEAEQKEPVQKETSASSGRSEVGSSRPRPTPGMGKGY